MERDQTAVASTPLSPCAQCMQALADAIEEQFQMPAAEALRHINAALAANPITRGMKLELRLHDDAA